MTTAHETLRELVGGKRYVVVAAQELTTPEAVILVARSFPGRLVMPGDVGTLRRPNLVAEGRAYAIDLNALEPKIV